jgi:hypothetical protein
VVEPAPRVVVHVERNREVGECPVRDTYPAGLEPKAARMDAPIRVGDQVAAHEADLNRSRAVVPQAHVYFCPAAGWDTGPRAHDGQGLDRLLSSLCSSA